MTAAAAVARLAAVPALRIVESGRRYALVATALATCAAVGLTLRHFGLTTEGFVWSAVQVLLGFIAAWDVLTRRILNAVVVPAALVVIVARAVFAPSALPESLLAGVLAFAVFLMLAILARGGLGMGDVKLAGLIGLLLGRASVGALLAGCIAGGVAAVLLILSRRATAKSTFAYGPYLALGAALWILVGSPLRLY